MHYADFMPTVPDESLLPSAVVNIGGKGLNEESCLAKENSANDTENIHKHGSGKSIKIWKGNCR